MFVLLQKSVIRRRPPGWSPLRNVQSFTVKDKKKDSSEEESSQDGTKTTAESTMDLNVAPITTTTPNPASTAAPLNCPGKPWKDFSPPPVLSAPRPPPPAPRPLSDSDLV